MRRPSYRPRDIEELIDTYEAVVCQRDTTTRGLRHLIAVADLKRGMHTMPLALREPLILYGIGGYSAEAVGKALSISHTAVLKRYRHALEHLDVAMNGGMS